MSGNSKPQQYYITQSEPGISLYDGLANVETKIAEFIVPDGFIFSIRKRDYFGLYLATSDRQELPDESLVKLSRCPHKTLQQIKVLDAYKRLKEIINEKRGYKIGSRFLIEPGQRLLIKVKSSLPVDKKQTRFIISSQRYPQT